MHAQQLYTLDIFCGQCRLDASEIFVNFRGSNLQAPDRQARHPINSSRLREPVNELVIRFGVSILVRWLLLVFLHVHSLHDTSMTLEL